MSIMRKSEAQWQGDLKNGEGTIKLGSKAYEGPYSFKGRTEEQSSQTNPEELIAAALAGCFSMQFSALLSKAGHPPEHIHSIAKVYMDASEKGLSVSKIELETEAKVPEISNDEFKELANKAEQICPISKALAAVTREFKATLL